MSSPPESADAPTDDRFAEYASGLADRLGALDFVAEFETVRIYVERDAWVETLRRARDDEDLVFFSWLSAIDWSREVAVGDPPEDEEVVERFEVLSRISDVDEGKGLIVSTVVSRSDPSIASLTGLFHGASWHEREAHEMFGIDFVGHPNLIKLYLPDGFEGNPLLKSFPLVSREVKPWPGTVDVEDMPSTENVEAGDE